MITHFFKMSSKQHKLLANNRILPLALVSTPDQTGKFRNLYRLKL